MTFSFFFFNFESISRVFAPTRGILWKLYGSLGCGTLHFSGTNSGNVNPLYGVLLFTSLLLDCILLICSHEGLVSSKISHWTVFFYACFTSSYGKIAPTLVIDVYIVAGTKLSIEY
jgi:hypothetical protein